MDRYDTAGCELQEEHSWMADYHSQPDERPSDFLLGVFAGILCSFALGCLGVGIVLVVGG